MREMKSYTCIRYFRWKRSYHQFNVNLSSSFQNQKTLDEQEKRGNIDGVGPSNIRTEEEELANLRGGRDSFEREVGGMTYPSKHTLELIESIL
jgi:hypothetical protein